MTVNVSTRSICKTHSYRAELKHIMAVKNLTTALVTALLLTGVWGAEDSVFKYATVGGNVVLPCDGVVRPDCSSISWSFYKGGHVQHTQEVSRGNVSRDSNKYGRLSITPNCFLHVRELKGEDAGAYMCERHLESGNSQINVYLSLLTVSSPSLITDLAPGGNLALSCSLLSYYSAGMCKSYATTDFKLSWVAEDGAQLLNNSRYEVIERSRCNVTLAVKLQREDNNRKWRCQLHNSKGNDVITFLDFTSTFVFQSPASNLSLTLSTPEPEPAAAQLPVSRIVLCVALPLMVLTVALYTRSANRKWAKEFAKGIEFQEIQ